MPTKIPQPLSTGEEQFALHCACYRINPEREYVFAAPRKWRADFAFVEEKIIVEIEGAVWSGGRHTRGTGFSSDCEKYNAAAILGYRVLRFTTDMVVTGRAIDLTMACIQGRAL